MASSFDYWVQCSRLFNVVPAQIQDFLDGSCRVLLQYPNLGEPEDLADVWDEVLAQGYLDDDETDCAVLFEAQFGGETRLVLAEVRNDRVVGDSSLVEAYVLEQGADQLAAIEKLRTLVTSDSFESDYLDELEEERERQRANRDRDVRSTPRANAESAGQATESARYVSQNVARREPKGFFAWLDSLFS